MDREGLSAEALKELRELEDRKLTNLILGLLSRAYDLEVGKDITKEKIEAWFVGRPELENLKTSIRAFFKAAMDG
jgi:hypothetical protein